MNARETLFTNAAIQVARLRECLRDGDDTELAATILQALDRDLRQFGSQAVGVAAVETLVVDWLRRLRVLDACLRVDHVDLAQAIIEGLESDFIEFQHGLEQLAVRQRRRA